MAVSTGVVRGCGVRQRGGIYSTSTLVEGGLPLEAFIYDPPLTINPTALGISPIGVELMEQNGVWHILDWIGSRHYTNVADFLEETRRFGLSRRLRKNLDFSKLSAGSKHLVIHARGHIENVSDYLNRRSPEIREWMNPRRSDPDFRCPKQYVAHHPDVPPRDALQAESTARMHQGWPEHTELEERLMASHVRQSMCASLWWEDVEGGTLLADGDPEDDYRINRAQPSFSYRAVLTPERHSYAPAIIAKFPISSLTVIRDPSNVSAKRQAWDAATQSGIRVDLEDE